MLVEVTVEDITFLGGPVGAKYVIGNTVLYTGFIKGYSNRKYIAWPSHNHTHFLKCFMQLILLQLTVWGITITEDTLGGMK